MLRYRSLILVLLCGSPAALATQIVVTMTPLKLVATALTSDLAEVVTLPSGGDPHLVTLRPSQLALLRNADLVLWVGHALEPGLMKELEVKRPPRIVISVQEAIKDFNGQLQLPFRDPHSWLDPYAMRALAYPVTEKLIRVLPGHANQLKANRDAFDREMGRLNAELTAAFSDHRGRGVLVTHDAYNWFFQRFGVMQLAALRDREGRAPGARSLAVFKAKARREDAACLVAHNDQSLGEALMILGDTPLKHVVLSPAGQEMREYDGYADFLRRFAHRLLTCLGN